MALISYAGVVDSQEWKDEALNAAFPYDGAKFGSNNVHDPSIVLFGDTYLMVHTSGHELSPISTSKDMREWKEHGSIQPDQPKWLKDAIPGHRSVWAPFPLAIGKRLRVYYCASEKFGQNTSYIAYCENASFDPAKPTVGWVDKGILVTSKAGESNFNAIDPDVCVGPDGRHWMVYGSYWSGIFMVELDPETGALKDPAKSHWHVASNSERGNPLEAPALIYRDGWYYLFVTYGLAAQGIRSTYRTMVGRSKTPEGPYLGYDGKPMTEGGHTVLIKGSFPMFAPGGGNWFKGADGQFYMAYHYYDARRNWHGDMWGAPTLQIRKVVWGEDGWPLPGLPSGVTLPKGSVEGDWSFQVDFGRVENLTLLKGGQIELGGRKGTWKQSSDELVFEWPNPGEKPFVDTLSLDSSGRFFIGRNQSGVVIRGIKRDVASAR